MTRRQNVVAGGPVSSTVPPVFGLVRMIVGWFRRGVSDSDTSSLSSNQAVVFSDVEPVAARPEVAEIDPDDS